MSPASQGGLEVERYIGTCLFSTHSRAGAGPAAKAAAAAAAAVAGGGGSAVSPAQPLGKTRPKGGGGNVGHGAGGGAYAFGPRYGRAGPQGAAAPQSSTPPPPPWAGLPLISLAAAQRRRPAPGTPGAACSDDGLAQLAMRTQGAPLILAGRYHHHHQHQHHHHQHHHSVATGIRPVPHHHGTRPRVTGPRAAPSAPRKAPAAGSVTANPATCPPLKDGKANGSAGDNLSVASDESSGGHSSENSLPRIIKPRKRRKKDRKPPPAPTASPASPDIPTTPPPPSTPSPPPLPPSPPPSSASTGDLQRCPEPAALVSPVAPASKPAVGAARAPGAAARTEDAGDTDACSSCQCRYCDPAGRVWAALPVGAVPLRRSWSEPTPAATALATPPSPLAVSLDEDSDGGGALQVSSHIVTSLHGHRDLEIRFFSSSPPQRSPPPVPIATAEACGSPWGTPSSPPPSPTSPPPALLDLYTSTSASTLTAAALKGTVSPVDAAEDEPLPREE